MPGERTLLNNFVGEADAPTKSAKAYLSNLVFQMLYAMANQLLMTLICFRSVVFHTEVMEMRSEADSKQPRGFGVFCNYFFALSL